MLLMKRQYFDAVRAGTKTTTLRYWRWARVRPGSVHKVPGLGLIRIDSVEPVSPAGLSDRDARTDGFESLDDLHRALRQMYPPQSRNGRSLYHVHFTYLR